MQLILTAFQSNKTADSKQQRQKRAHGNFTSILNATAHSFALNTRIIILISKVCSSRAYRLEPSDLLQKTPTTIVYHGRLDAIWIRTRHSERARAFFYRWWSTDCLTSVEKLALLGPFLCLESKLSHLSL